MPKQTQDAVLTIDELAVYLKLSKSTLYKLCAEGKIPGQKVGRHWRFHRSVIDAWISGPPSGGEADVGAKKSVGRHR